MRNLIGTLLIAAAIATASVFLLVVITDDHGDPAWGGG